MSPRSHDLTKPTLKTDFAVGDLSARNRLVQGDNNDVLSIMAEELRAAVRCIYIDPPYNNSERYTHYTDRVSHDVWLQRMEETLRRLRPCLTADGSIWISIDDQQMHYLKVLADGVFGRRNFVTTIVWEHRTTRENRRVFSNNHEYVLVYAADVGKFAANRNGLAPTEEVLKRYQNPDNDPRGPWQSVSANVQAGHGTRAQFYDVVAPNGRRHAPPPGRCWAYSEERMREAIAQDIVWFGRDGNGVPRLKRFLRDARPSLTPETLWTAARAGTTTAAKRHLLSLLPSVSVFDTPKPETLIERILAIATDADDLVLDAYLGSGTTATTAHKMGRRWVGIEVGEHAATHAVARVRKVVAGEDPGGITDAYKWRGGGGFSFQRVVADDESAADGTANESPPSAAAA